MRHVLTLFASLCVACAVRAEPFDFNRDCAKWIAQKGYSKDYIELKTGKVQPGWPESWRGNLDVHSVQPGDVATYFVPEKGKASRVSYVEEVRRDGEGRAIALVVSEWNWGKYIDERCLVSDHFGRVSVSKPIGINEIVKVWRPSLPLPPVTQ